MTPPGDDTGPLREADLVGTWELVAWENVAGDGTTTPFGGASSTGRLVYTPDGFMSAHIAFGDRPLSGTGDPLGGSDERLLAAFRTFIAYSGRYRVEGDEAVHDVDLSLWPDWVGQQQRRTVSWEDGLLVLTPPPMEVGGVTNFLRLRWRRADPG